MHLGWCSPPLSRPLGSPVPAGGLLHPLPVLMLLLLVFNDHWWKGVGPAAITGKLSDRLRYWERGCADLYDENVACQTDAMLAAPAGDFRRSPTMWTWLRAFQL